MKENTPAQLTTLGNNIYMYMTRSRLTQRELARMVGKTEATMSRYINGRREPSAITLFRMSKTFGCTMEDLMCGVMDGKELGHRNSR